MKKILFCFLLTPFLGCYDGGYPMKIVETRHCLVDSIELKKSSEPMARGFIYVYHTNCDVTITESGPRRYSIGDTIKFIYKKFENNYEQ
jgi:hypothetical protein